MIRSQRVAGLALALVFGLAIEGRADDSTDASPGGALSASQQGMLASLDPAVVKECLDTAAQLATWRQDADALRKQIQANADATDQADAVFRIATTLAGRSKPFRDLIGFTDKMTAGVKGAATRDAQQAVAASLLPGLQQVFTAIDAARSPAQFARGFIDKQLKQQFLNNPYSVGDVTFTLVQQDYTRSVFSPDANIGIVISYAEAGLQVKASGLYFRYRTGSLPEPVFDKVKPDKSSLNGLVSTGLKQLGDALPDLGLPIQIQNPQFTDFSPANGDLRGSLSFTISLSLAQLDSVGLDQLPALTADVVLYRKGKPKVGRIKATLPLDPPVPLGTTGLVLVSGSVELNPQTKQVTLGAVVATVAGAEALSLNLQATFGFPVAKAGVQYSGTLQVGQVPLGKAWGEITRAHVTLNLDAGIPGGARLTAKGEINKGGLAASGKLDGYFGMVNAQADVFIGTSGSGSFTVSEGIDIGGDIKATASLSGSYSPGFRKLVLAGAVTVEADGGIFGKLAAALGVTASLDPQPDVHVQGNALGMGFDFHVESFPKIYAALGAALGNARQNLYNALANAEQAAGAYAADREKALDGWVSQQAAALGIGKVSIDNGGPIDQKLGSLAKTGHQWEGGLSDAVHQAGGEGHDVMQHWSDVGSSVLGGHFASGGQEGPPALRIGGLLGLADVPGHEIDKTIKDLQRAARSFSRGRRTIARLDGLAQQFDRVKISKAKHDRKGEASELRLRLDRTLTKPLGDSEAVLTFEIQTSGFRHTLDPRKFARPVMASGVKVGRVHLRGLDGKGRPQVEIVIPTLRHGSAWEAERLLRDELSAIVDRFLVASGLEGRFQERYLVLQNRTGEALTVWVQVESRGGAARAPWKWLPTGPGAGSQGYRFHVPAGNKLLQLRTGTQYLHGRHARVWAEGESGRTWAEYRSADLDLLEGISDAGSQSYYDREMESFVLALTAPPGPRTFHEHFVSLRNDTDQPLLVHAEVLGSRGGKAAWEAVPKPVLVAAGKTAALEGRDGLRLRGSEVKVWAADQRDEHYQWNRHRTAPLRLGDERGYSAAAMGTFVCALEPPSRPGKETTAGPSLVRLPADEVMLPPLKGKPIREAEALLTHLGFHPVAEAKNPQAAVTEQSPGMGWHPAGTKVHLSAAGAPPAGRVAVPDFSHKTLEAAEEEARPHGLRVLSAHTGAPPTRQTRDTKLIGKVLIVHQTPAHGEHAARGTVVEVSLVHYVAEEGPAPGEKVRVPSFRLETLEAAQAAARKHGLVVRLKPSAPVAVTHTKDRELIDKVLIHEQHPAEGAMVPRGEVVEVTLTRFVHEPPPGKPNTNPHKTPGSPEHAQAEEAEKRRQQALEAERRREAEEAEKRRQMEAEKRRQQTLEAERRRQAEEAEKRRQQVEAEKQRQQALEAERRREAIEAERRRQQMIEAEKRRQQALEAERRRQKALEVEKRKRQRQRGLAEIKVPDVRKLGVVEAQAVIEEAGLEVVLVEGGKVVPEEEYPRLVREKAVVVEQSPAPGGSPSGDHVRCVVEVPKK